MAREHAATGKLRAAFDFEAWDWTNALCCALVIGDEKDPVTEFIYDKALKLAKPKSSDWNPNKVAEDTLKLMHARTDVHQWWAHNMGKYDGLILSAAAVRLGWEQTATIAGGNRVICLALKPRNSKHWVRLYDSFAIVPSSLRSCAQDFELDARKTLQKDDYRFDARTWGFDKLKSGATTDALLVLQLLGRVESFVEAWGGTLRATFSSSALSIIKSDLKSQGTALPRIGQRTNETARLSYYGARIEVFHHKPTELLTEYDVASSYPWSMTQPLPWIPQKIVNGREAKHQMLTLGEEGIIYAKVNVPKQNLPPLPFSQDGIYFPTGEWRAWFPACELRYAERECGVKVEPISGITFSRAQPFSEFIHKVYRLKSEAKGAQRMFAKLMLNGAYGKFGQKPESFMLKVFANETDAKSFVLRNRGLCSAIGRDGTTIAVKRIQWPKHTHYAVASYITAYSRILLHRALSESKNPAYCDTDSVHCRHLGWNLGGALGQLKEEINGYRGEFYAPKIYRLIETSGHLHIACKGFPVHCVECASKEAKDRPKGCSNCSAQFDQITHGREVARGRMHLMKSQLKKGGTQAIRAIDNKAWHGMSTKRKPFADGTTEPWSVQEILEDKHKQAKSPWR